MSVHVQGTINASPLTQTSEPSSPITGTSLTLGGTPSSLTIGPYTNNSSIPLKITNVGFANAVDVTGMTAPTLPIIVAPSAGVNLVITGINPQAIGSYSFDVVVTWST